MVLLVVAILLAVFVLDEPWTWVAVARRRDVRARETTLIVRWSQRRTAVVGAEALVGQRALVAADAGPTVRCGSWASSGRRAATAVRTSGRKWSSRLSMA